MERRQHKEDILKVLRSSNEVLCDFKCKIENKFVIILVGNTRSGKSTLANYIKDAPLVGVQCGYTYKIDCPTQNVATIGHGTLSHTTIPTVIELPKNPNTLLIDAPGFADNRGAAQEILNALYINQIKHAKGVKFVLISDIADILRDNINSFLSLIKTVAAIMPDFENLKDRVFLVFTKVTDEYDRLEVCAILKEKFISSSGICCNTDLIKCFVDQPDLIGILKMPNTVGLITYDLGDNVRNAVLMNKCACVNEHDIKYGISAAAKVVLLEAYSDFFDVCMNLQKVIINFSELVMSKFYCLEKANLPSLSEEQLNGAISYTGNVSIIVKAFYNRITAASHVGSVLEITDQLSSLFIHKLAETFAQLKSVQILPTVLEECDNSKIEELRRHLEYLVCVEKVVEMNNQSESIINTYKKSFTYLADYVHSLSCNIEWEISYRKYLFHVELNIGSILPKLEQVDKEYLESSTDKELEMMKNEATAYENRVNHIRDGIQSRLTSLNNINIKQVLDNCEAVMNRIQEKVVEIDCHVKSRSSKSDKWSFQQIQDFGTKMINNRNRLAQGRLIVHRTVLDDCCKDLL